MQQLVDFNVTTSLPVVSIQPHWGGNLTKDNPSEKSPTYGFDVSSLFLYNHALTLCNIAIIVMFIYFTPTLLRLFGLRRVQWQNYEIIFTRPLARRSDKESSTTPVLKKTT
jgi:hypothetical protein